MYNILVSLHSILRWALVISFLITIIYGFYNRFGNKPFTTSMKKLSLTSLTIVNIQFVLGLILYLISPKVIFSSMAMKAPLTRFFLVEHITAMIIAIALISIGYSASKKALTDSKKYNKILIFYTIGFLIILAAIPWPFYNFGTNWF